MNVLDRDTQRLIFTLWCRQNGVRDMAEATGCSTNTILRHVARYGEACTAIHDRLIRNVTSAALQIDETWSFVYAKEYENIKPGSKTKPKRFGTVYKWIGFDPDTKLLVSWHVSDRTMTSGREFFSDLADRVPGEVLVTTDAYVGYPELVDRAFGSRARHVILRKDLHPSYDRKTRDREVKLVKIEKEVIKGSEADLRLASTSLVERLNCSIRNFNARCARSTLKFSKKMDNHKHSVAAFAMYYNFLKPHYGFKGAERHLTPAMKAGFSSKVWTWDDLLDEVDAYWATKERRAELTVVDTVPQFTPLVQHEKSTKPYFVLFSHLNKNTKVHDGNCVNCNHGLGRGEGASRNKWYAFDNLEAARSCAEILASHDHSECSVCIKKRYKTMRRPA